METKRGKEYEYRKTQMEEMSKETREVKEKKGRDNWKLATWNVRETKKKGIGEQVMRGDHLMIYGGVKYEQHGAAGVGCIIDKNWRKYVEHWQVCSERLLKVRLRREKSELWNIIVAYGPNEDAKVEDKNKFWEELNMVTEECRGKIVVCGDFNSRVGIGGGRDGIVGKYGETKKTNNGERLIEYCRMNNMIVSNTFFEHKDVHRYTRHGHNVDDRSIIDYFLVERDNRRDIADVRVHRGAEIGSDHYMLVAKIMSEGKEKVEHRQLNEGYENIKSYKLREMSVAEEYRKDVEENMTRVEIGVEEGVEEVWGRFKNILMESAKRVCGSVKIGRNRRGTAWWNDNLKRQIKMKKILWKKYLKNRNACNYRKYKEQRKRVKQVTLEEKEKTWRDFGERMEKNYTENRKLFYRVMKNMRKGEKVDNTSIKCKRNRLLVGEKEIMERWKEHFIELLKGNEVKKVDTQKKDKR
ncbi:uncharacterized protein LOC123678663 [Harmonia axyridis]|uniref:uncharacterized protein LOC123678663 n=1 Tax=Harmonia axyridis TaxID=115357 RepID=UPI001E277E9D|nr:uncharacterized protein LOC123678663 [Harmonia axyridis]